MDQINKLLAKRKTTPFSSFASDNGAGCDFDKEKTRAEILSRFEKEIYGVMPSRPDHLSVEVISEDNGFAAGNAIHRRLRLTVYFGEDQFSFTVNEAMPKSRYPLPVFLHIDTSDSVPSRHTPHEELCDEGFCVFSFCAFDISHADQNFRCGISRHLGTRRSPSAPGKLSIWAWAAMRVMDYIETLDYIDKSRIAIVGNTIMGKAALLAGAYDTRFTHVISSSSGIFGASLTKSNKGTPPLMIMDSMPYLFAPGLAHKMQRAAYLPTVDQHLLLSLIAPRYLIIASATGDYLGDVESDFLCAVAASDAYKAYGVNGLIHNGEVPTNGALLDGGRIIHYVREGVPYISRRDWQIYMRIVREK